MLTEYNDRCDNVNYLCCRVGVNMKSDTSTSKHEGSRLQTMANLLTILVAVAAIGLSVWEGRENRLHNRLSVLPRLERVQSIVRDGLEDSTYTVTYALENSGLGPAVLQKVLVFEDGEKVFESSKSEDYFDFAGFLDEINALPFYIGAYTHGRAAGEMLQAEKEHLLFRLEVEIEGDDAPWTPGIVKEQVIDRYSFAFCYCSVYGENCAETYLGAKPPVDSCSQ